MRRTILSCLLLWAFWAGAQQPVSDANCAQKLTVTVKSADGRSTHQLDVGLKAIPVASKTKYNKACILAMWGKASGAFWWTGWGTAAFPGANPAAYLAGWTIRVSSKQIVAVDSAGPELLVQWSIDNVPSLDQGWPVVEHALREKPKLAYMDTNDFPDFGRRAIGLDVLVGRAFNLPPGREMSSQTPGRAVIREVEKTDGHWRVQLLGRSGASASIILNDKFEVIKVER